MVANTDIQTPQTTMFLGMHRFKWLAPEASTNGSFSCADITVRAGGEPPPHTHTREGQAFLLPEGEVTFRVGDRVIRTRPGDFLWAPRNVEHAFELHTPSARMIEMSTPGGLENAFLALSRPALDDEPLPELQGPPPAEAIEALVSKFGEYGISFSMP